MILIEKIKIMRLINRIICNQNKIVHNQQKIIRKVKQMATVLEKVQEYADSINLATDEIAADLLALKEQLAGAGTPEEVQAILQPVLDRLNALGQEQ